MNDQTNNADVGRVCDLCGETLPICPHCGQAMRCRNVMGHQSLFELVLKTSRVDRGIAFAMEYDGNLLRRLADG